MNGKINAEELKRKAKKTMICPLCEPVTFFEASCDECGVCSPIMKKVNRYTRAGTEGKEIYCPICDTAYHVYHFSWNGVMCGNCKEMIDKCNWLLDSRKTAKEKGDEVESY